MYIRYIGHSCFSLEGARKVLTDPMPPEAANVDADLVLVTHGHGDHLGITVDLKKQTVAIHELARYLARKDVPAIGMGIGGTVAVGGVKVTMVPAVHSSSVEENGIDLYMGSSAGFVVEMDGVVVYHAGDTALFSDMKLIRDLYHPDAALLPVGGHYTMGPEEAMIAAEWIGAPLVIPMHYNTFRAIEQNLMEFRQAIESTTSMQVAVVRPGDGVAVLPRK
ncbi:MAG: metal-dependent hydrolase [Methanocalculaceae archaeon]|jgi:L-ascorbate metabolism protein UlaG (beta-lactamase superfamily)|nr:metal-dependent hydrolase [Methanocalculaceae archaeon]